MSHRRAKIAVVLALLLLGPFIWGIGPNFLLEINDCSVGYFASFSVSLGGESIFETDSELAFMESNPSGFTYDDEWVSDSEAGGMVGGIYARVLWSPALTEDAPYLTEASQADAAFALAGSTTSIGTGSCTGLAASAMSEAGVEGTKTGETAWRTSRFHCFFNMDLSGSIVNGSGGAGTTVTWGDSQEFANIATTWSSTNGYATVGFYMIDGQAENINNSASGAQGTASIIVQTKQQAGSGDSISYEPIPHTAWAGTGLDSLNNSGGLNISGTATTQVWAVGYPE